jgi:chromosomal replication initiation ATPase DnaA
VVEKPPACPFAKAFGGLILGSGDLLARMRGRLRDRPADAALPELEPLRPRPSVAAIVAAVAHHFGCDVRRWQPGRRFDDAARAVAAYLARRHFRHPAREVQAALGYASHGGVHNAVRRVDGNDHVRQTAEQPAARLD